MKLVIESLDHQGRGLAKQNEKVYFVDNAIEGEEVEVNILKTKKNICECEVTKYYKLNEYDRIKPICPYYKECGGCDIMHIKNQNKYKKDKLNNIINKYVDKNLEIDEVVNLNNLNYRNKITLQVQNKKLGLYRKKSNQIVEIDNCYLVKESINDLIKIIKNEINLENVKQIVIKASEEIMVIFYTTKNTNININPLKQKVHSIYINDKKIFGKDKIIEKMDDYQFLVSPESFFQVNNEVATAMYNYINSLIENVDVLFDLYCGTGTIGIFLNKKAKKIIGIEINQSAIKDANQNIELNKVKNTQFFCTDAANITNKTNLKPDTIIIDPPRSGLDKKMIDDIKKLKPKQIIYVSCDPMTLARDLKEFTEYEIKNIKGFDMFPNTYHVETVVNLNLRS